MSEGKKRRRTACIEKPTTALRRYFFIPLFPFGVPEGGEMIFGPHKKVKKGKGGGGLNL